MPIGHGKCNFCYSFLLAPKKEKQVRNNESEREEGEERVIARGRRVCSKSSTRVFLPFAFCCESTNKRRKKNIRKSVEYFLFYAFYVTHTHKHTDSHTLTENMRGKFSRFENKAEKCRKKLAIGLTLPNKLTRFRCDAEYQSPPDDSDSARVLCPSWRGWKATRGAPRGTNGTEHSWFVW